MNKTIKCKNCGKESPESGILFDEKSIKSALEAPLDCNGNSMYDFSELKKSRKQNENYCYWCGAKIEIEEPKSEPKPLPKQESKPLPPPPPQKSHKSPTVKWLLILFGVVVVMVLFFCVKSCGSDSDSNYEEADDVSLVNGMGSIGEDYELATDVSSSDVGESIIVTDYSKEWTSLESRLKKLGSPLEYVNANSSKNPTTIKDDSYNTYKSIKDEAYELYQKIKDGHYKRYQKLKDAKYKEYQKIKDAAYSRYQNDEIDYSKYDDIQSEAYDKYNTIQSKAYDTYSDIQSKAYDRYQALQSDAYDWQSKVRSIASGL